MDWIKRINRWDILILAAFIAALFIRLMNLDQVSLTDSEASLSMQALDIARGVHPTLSAQPFYILGTSILFYVFMASTFLARLLPALFGAGLVFLPCFLRKRIGDLPTLLLAFFFALEPGLVAASRTAGSDMLALVCTAFAAAFWLKKRPVPAGIFTGLAILCGEMFWYGLVVIGLTAAIVKWLIKPESIAAATGIEADQAEDPDGQKKQAPELALISGGIVVILLGTLFFFQPSGLSAMAASIPQYFSGWVTASGVHPAMLAVAFCVYEFFILVYGLWGILQSWLKDDSYGKILSIWFLVSFVVSLIYSGRRVDHLLWTILPMSILAARAIGAFFDVPERHRASSLIYAVFVFIMIVFIYINLTGILAPGMTSENVQTRVIIIISAILVLLVATVLVAAGWSIPPAVYGLTFGVLASLTLGSLSTSMAFATVRETQRYELWGEQQILVDEPLVEQTVRELSDWKIGNQTELNITVVGLDTPSMRWALRDEQNTRYVDYLPGGSTPPIVISTSEEQPKGSTAYRGQDFTWSETPDWGGLAQGDWLTWLLWRKSPYQTSILTLWARIDLFPGGSITPEGS
jgi:hypothetical protein